MRSETGSAGCEVEIIDIKCCSAGIEAAVVPQTHHRGLLGRMNSVRVIRVYCGHECHIKVSDKGKGNLTCSIPSERPKAEWGLPREYSIVIVPRDPAKTRAKILRHPTKLKSIPGWDTL